MHGFATLLRDGLRLALLLPPRQPPPAIGLLALLGLLALNTLLALPGTLQSIEPPWSFNPGALGTLLAQLGLSLLVAAVLARLCQRPRLWLGIAGWILASNLLPGALLGLLNLFMPPPWDATNPDPALSELLSGPLSDLLPPLLLTGLLLWQLLVLLRIGLYLAPRPARGVAATLAALLTSLLLLALPDEAWIITDWENWQGEFAPEDWAESEPDYHLPEPEKTLYAQSELLAAALQKLAPQRPDKTDLYLIGFAGDASEGAFRNEVDFLPTLAAARLDAEGRVLRLVNRVETAAELPLASVSNLERALHGLARHLDPDEDILLLYLSSHGGPAPEHQLLIQQPPLPLDQLAPARLRQLLDSSGIRNRVIVISACFSGGYLEALDDPDTLVITAARADRSSFGCGNSANATWFGQAFLIEALNQSADFQHAFQQARQRILEREQRHGHEASEPQWQAGSRILPLLSAWSQALPPGHSARFIPSVEVVATEAENADGGNATAEQPASLDSPAAEPPESASPDRSSPRVEPVKTAPAGTGPAEQVPPAT